MAKGRYIPNPAAEVPLNAQFDVAMLAAAEAAALKLYDNLDESTSARTGEQYAGQPRRSSTPTQMPQSQTGTLQGMVDYGPLGDGAAWFGLDPQGADELTEALVMEKGAPRGNVIARAPVLRTAFDSRTHREMNAAVLRARK